jgi:hypothetical protein
MQPITHMTKCCSLGATELKKTQILFRESVRRDKVDTKYNVIRALIVVAREKGGYSEKVHQKRSHFS